MKLFASSSTLSMDEFIKDEKVQYQVEDIQVVDSISTDDYAKDNFIVDYDSELTFPFAASESWESLVSDGFTIYNDYQNIDNIKELSWTELAPGEEQEVTTIYLVDSDHIDQAYLGFFKDYGGYNADGQPVNDSGYVKVE